MRRTLAIAVALVVAAPLHAQETKLSFSPPAGWSVTRQASGATMSHPTEAQVRIVLRAQDSDGTSLAQLIASVQQTYKDAKPLTTRIGGVVARGVRLTLTAGGARLVVRQWFFLRGTRRYTLAMVAPPDRFAAHEATFVAFRTSCTPAPGGAPATPPASPLLALARRCGSQLRGAPSWDAAVKEALARRRPILVALWLMPGWVGVNAQETGPFSAPDVIALVRSRFVLLRMSKAAALASPLARPRIHGMFGNTSNHVLLVVDPRGPRVVRRIPRPVEVVVDAQLRAALAALPDLPGEPARPGDARALLARGELTQALAATADPQIRAACYRRLRKGALALRALAAVEAPVEEALIRLRMGQLERAAALLATASSPEALFWRGAIQLRTAERATAEATWRTALDRPDDPWTWRIAAALTRTSANSGPPLHWPTEALLDTVRHQPLQRASLATARSTARAYLLRTQQADGSWLTPTLLSRFEPGQPEAFSEAGTALAALALIDEGPAGHAAVRKALAYLGRYDAHRAAARPRAFPGFVFRIWAHGYRLRLLARARQAGLIEAGAAARRARPLIAALRSCQAADGGWSYASGSAVRGGSMSFTIAAHLRSIAAAAAAGLPTDAGVVEKAMRCLRRTRTASGQFAYRAHQGPPRAGAPESAGRGPQCCLALGLDPRQALARFAASIGPMREVIGQGLTHSGRGGLGSHYLLMNVEGAAAAIARSGDTRHRAAVLDLLLSMRRADGSVVDNLNFGPHIGTALALRALQQLDD